MNHLLESLGWTLVHFCWQAAAIAAVYAVLDQVFARRSSHFRYSLALAALLLMPAMAVTTFAYKELHSVSPAFAITTAPIGTEIKTVTHQITIATGMAQTEPSASSALSFSAVLLWLDTIWIFGVLLLSMRAVGGWWFLEKLRNRTSIEVPERVSNCLQAVCRRLELVKPVVLRLSDETITPLAMGIFRAVVILPLSTVSTLTAEELEVVIAHELAHIRRADYLWNLIQTFLETVFFFHPCVWWVSRCIREQRELCCDDIALMTCADPVTYATALLRLEEQRKRGMQFAMALHGTGSRFSLAARVRRILGEPVLRQPRSFAAHSLIILGLTLSVSLLPASQLFAKLAPPLKSQIQAASLHLSAAPDLKTPAIASVTNPVSKATIAAVNVPEPSPAPEPAPQAQPEPASDNKNANTSQSKNSDYIDGIKASGYDVDLDNLIAFKVQGITPEYIRGILKSGFPKPSAGQLIALKVQGVTPEYIESLRKSGIAPDNVNELISYKIFNITPEYLSGMKAAGFGDVTPNKLIGLKVQGVTPELARTVKQQFPDATLDDLIQFKIFNIDANFLAAAKRHGFDHLPVKKLIQLRISGILDDNQR